MPTCTVVGCGRSDRYAKGLCGMHYSRFRRTGTTEDRPITGTYVRNHKSTSEHRVIAERVLGRPLPPKVHIHHVDDNGRNNANGNLVICQDAAYHMELHRRKRILRAGGNPNTDWWCSGCRRPVARSLFHVRRSGRKAGVPVTHCKPCLSTRDRSQERAI